MKTVLARVFATLLLFVFGYASLIKDVHFLFTHHEITHNEHCTNHVHAGDEHDICSFCAIALPYSTELAVQVFEIFVPTFSFPFKTELTKNIVPHFSSFYLLRGPPSLQ